jgi:hypothetical protein
VSDDVGMNGMDENDVFLKGVQVSDDVGVGGFKLEGDWVSAGIGHGSLIEVLEHVQVL